MQFRYILICFELVLTYFVRCFIITLKLKTQTQVHYHFATQNVEVSPGININYTDTGYGNPIIFIHGLANYANVWQLQQQHLKQHRCIAFDLPGCGLSSKGYLPYSMLYFSEILLKFIQKLKLTEVTICGHSMGGHIAIIFALRYPNLCKNLILIAPSGFERFTTFEVAYLQQVLTFGNWFIPDETKLVQSLKQSFLKLNESGVQMIDDLLNLLSKTDAAMWRNMVNKCIIGMLTESVFDLLPFLTAKTLVVFGEQDALIPNTLLHYNTTRKIAETACKQIPNAALHIFNGAGHAVFLEKPQQVNNCITNFLY